MEIQSETTGKINWQNLAITALSLAFTAWAYVAGSAKHAILEKLSEQREDLGKEIAHIEEMQRAFYARQEAAIAENHAQVELVTRRLEQHINDFYQVRGDLRGDIQMLKDRYGYRNRRGNSHDTRDDQTNGGAR